MDTKNYKNYIKVIANCLLDSLDRAERVKDSELQKVILKATLTIVRDDIQEILNLSK